MHFDAVTATVLKIDGLASMPLEPIGPRRRWQRRGTGERFSRSRRAGRTRSVFAAEDAVRVATSDFALDVTARTLVRLILRAPSVVPALRSKTSANAIASCFIVEGVAAARVSAAELSAGSVADAE